MIIGAGEPSDRTSIDLATRAGRRIPNEQRPEWAPERIWASIRLWKEQRPQAEVRSRGSALYNCVGLVFASRRTSVDTVHAERILSEDGFRRVEDGEQPAIGDVVVYRRNRKLAHVGYVVQNDSIGREHVIKVLSKWGPECEYTHPLTHVPESFGQPVEFWTDRHGQN